MEPSVLWVSEVWSLSKDIVDLLIHAKKRLARKLTNLRKPNNQTWISFNIRRDILVHKHDPKANYIKNNFSKTQEYKNNLIHYNWYLRHNIKTLKFAKNIAQSPNTLTHRTTTYHSYAHELAQRSLPRQLAVLRPTNRRWIAWESKNPQRFWRKLDTNLSKQKQHRYTQ